NTKRRLRPPRRFDEFLQAKFLRQNTQLGLPGEFFTIDQHFLHEPGMRLMKARRIVLVIQDVSPEEFAGPPHYGTNKWVGCINPFRTPAPDPIHDPQTKEQIL